MTACTRANLYLYVGFRHSDRLLVTPSYAWLATSNIGRFDAPPLPLPIPSGRSLLPGQCRTRLAIRWLRPSIPSLCCRSASKSDPLPARTSAKPSGATLRCAPPALALTPHNRKGGQLFDADPGQSFAPGTGLLPPCRRPRTQVCFNRGMIIAPCRSIRMEKLDSLVTTHLADRLFRPQRLKALLAGLQAATVDEHFRLVEQEALKGDEWPRRLYRLVEDGAVRGGPTRPHRRSG